MTQLIYEARWHGEPDIGLFPGSEEITITFRHGTPIGEDVIEFFRRTLEEFYDNACVELLDTKES